MMGDGKTAYDHDHDNAANELAACSVGQLRSSACEPSHTAGQVVGDRVLTGILFFRNTSDGGIYLRKRDLPTSRGRYCRWGRRISSLCRAEALRPS